MRYDDYPKVKFVGQEVRLLPGSPLVKLLIEQTSYEAQYKEAEQRRLQNAEQRLEAAKQGLVKGAFDPTLAEIKGELV